MESKLTEEQRTKMKRYLAENPVNRDEDDEAEYYDGNITPEQSLSRVYERFLEIDDEQIEL